MFATTTKICTSGGSSPVHTEAFNALRCAFLLAGASRSLAMEEPLVPPADRYRDGA